MPRLRYIEENEKTPHARELIESAKRTGAPDPRVKAALRYADLFKQGEHAIDRDGVYRDLSNHFSDEEIIELGLLCAQTDGVGKFVKSLNVLSWEEACELNPKLTRGPPQEAAE
jgi:alkylhydroperoxidase family enzyme